MTSYERKLLTALGLLLLVLFSVSLYFHIQRQVTLNVSSAGAAHAV